MIQTGTQILDQEQQVLWYVHATGKSWVAHQKQGPGPSQYRFGVLERPRYELAHKQQWIIEWHVPPLS